MTSLVIQTVTSEKLPALQINGLSRKGINVTKVPEDRPVGNLPILSKTGPLLLSGDTLPKTAVSVKRGQGITASVKPYRYKYLPGNNGRIILKAFQKRPWWQTSGGSVPNKVKNSSKEEDEKKKDDGTTGPISFDIVWEVIFAFAK